jgi:hypothetical protein
MVLTASVRDIQSAITDEIFYALGLKHRGLLRRGLGWVFTRPTRIFARFMAAVDEAVGLSGPPAGCQRMLDQLGVQIQTRGRENIPREGPVIVLSNHPGAYDSMAIGSLIPRPDLKAIVSKTRLYQVLPNIYPNFFQVGDDPSENMLAIRGAVSHLRQGGILLQFGSGLIEPDPATHQVDDAVFDRWSSSLEILFRKAPETRVVPTIASGVLLERFLKHGLVRLRRDTIDKRRLAEFIQVIRQLVKPESVQAVPRISFGKPFTLAEVLQEGEDRRVMPAVIHRMKAHLMDHLAWIQGRQAG